ncbi:glycosyltransferase family 1 protein [Spirosoma jeollabukense]
MNDSNALSSNLSVLPLVSTTLVDKKSARTNQSGHRTGASNDLDDLICFSHLRWNFVYQRPQHLLSRAARRWRIWYIEEPIQGDSPGLVVSQVSHQLSVVVPRLPPGLDPDEALQYQRDLLDQLLTEQHIQNYALWYYTPMALAFSDHLRPRLTVYDCMDELSAFLGAPPRLIEQERQLLNRADVVFTGGYSLYEAKQKRHSQVYAFPSCIDFDHFTQARKSRPGRGLPDPVDQQPIAGPRIGYSGVIDERLDLSLIEQLARRRPDWQFVLLGPVVKINPDELPQGPNLHYLGMKAYNELPAYFSHWQAAMMPFAINEATRYISPTKTPEFLAAGLPVVSTPIQDVVRTYGGWEQTIIAGSVSAFEAGLSLVIRNQPSGDRLQLDQFLQEQSWENTWQQMQHILAGQLQPIVQ